MGRKLFILIFVILFYIMGGYGITERLDDSNLSSNYANVNSDMSIDSITLEYTNNNNSFDSNYIDNTFGANDGIHLNETMVKAIVPNQIVWLLNQLIKDREIIANPVSNPISTPKSTEIATFLPSNPVSTPITTVESTKTPFIWTLQATPTPYTLVLVGTEVPTIDSEVAVIEVTSIEINETPTRLNTSTATFVPEIIIENTIESTSTSTQVERTPTSTPNVTLAVTYTTIVPTSTPILNVQPTNTKNPVSTIDVQATPTWTPESATPTFTSTVDWNATPPTVQPTLTPRETYTLLPTLTPLPTLTQRPTYTRIP